MSMELAQSLSYFVVAVAIVLVPLPQIFKIWEIHKIA